MSKNRDFLNHIDQYLLKCKDQELDKPWASDYYSWDKSDCSEFGILKVSLQYLIDNYLWYDGEVGSPHCLDYLEERLEDITEKVKEIEGILRSYK